MEALEDKNDFAPIYPLDASIHDKIETVARKVYGADGVTYSRQAARSMSSLEDLGYGGLPICVAKTQMSFSDDASLKGAPKGWDLNIRDIRVSAGAGFLVVLTGTMLTMPGLPKQPAAEKMDILEDGTITGLF